MTEQTAKRSLVKVTAAGILAIVAVMVLYYRG